MKYQVLSSPKNNTKISKTIVCCSRDCDCSQEAILQIEDQPTFPGTLLESYMFT